MWLDKISDRILNIVSFDLKIPKNGFYDCLFILHTLPPILRNQINPFTKRELSQLSKILLNRIPKIKVVL